MESLLLKIYKDKSYVKNLSDDELNYFFEYFKFEYSTSMQVKSYFNSIDMQVIKIFYHLQLETQKRKLRFFKN